MNQPDFSKLNIILANSGVQKWNTPIYEILKRLIDAAGQSQTSLSEEIQNIINDINTNVLTQNFAGLTFIGIGEKTLGTTELDNLSGTPQTIVNAVPNRIIIPLFWSATTVKNATAWTNGGAVYQLIYANAAALTTPAVLATGLSNAIAGTENAFALATSQSRFSNLTFPLNTAIQINSSLNMTPGAGPPASTATAKFSLAYLLVPGS